VHVGRIPLLASSEQPAEPAPQERVSFGGDVGRRVVAHGGPFASDYTNRIEPSSGGVGSRSDDFAWVPSPWLVVVTDVETHFMKAPRVPGLVSLRRTTFSPSRRRVSSLISTPAPQATTVARPRRWKF